MRALLLLALLPACVIDAPTFHEADGGTLEIDAGIDAMPDAAHLTTSTSPHDFSDVTAGMTSAPYEITVTNDGTAASGALDVALAGTAPGQFELVAAGADDCDGQVLEPSDTCVAQVRFHPTAGGAASARLEVSATPGGLASVDVEGNGLSPGSLEITAGATLPFGTQEIQSQSAAQTITVHNTGRTATSPLSTVVGDGTSYTVTADSCDDGPLGADATCTVDVKFNPAVVGSLPSQISIRESPSVGVAASATGTGTARLQVDKTGTGSVSSNLSGISCGGGCGTQTASFSQTPVTLTATDGGGFAFDGWTGACAGTSSTMCSVPLTTPLTTVGATFVQVYPLDVTPTGSGVVTANPAGISCGSGATDCSELYETGTGVTLTATPDANFEVYSWSAPGCSQGEHTCSVTMDQARTVSVEFRRQYTVTVTPSGSGTGTITGGPISCPGTCTARLFVGTQVTLTEAPGTPATNSQLVFSGWGFSSCTSLTTTCVVTMDADQTLTPYFTLRHRLAITLAGTGAGKVTPTSGSACLGGTCTLYYDEGASPTVTALTTNATGSYFAGFSGGCSGPARVCTLLMDAPKTILATFSPQAGNLVFLSSATYPANLGGTAPYDAACNTLATAAGINNAGGTGFIAWMSDENSLAKTRLGTATRGFTRMDGLAFADTQATLLAYPAKVFHPIIHDENGVDPGPTTYFTATDHVGALLSRHCSNWSTTSEEPTPPYGAWGGMTHAANEWSIAGPLECGSAQRILCVGKTSTTAVAPSFAGKRIYVTNANVLPGSISPDAACASSKPAGAAGVHAVVATTTTSAASKLSSATTYVRPDGSLVGTGAEIATGTLTAGPSQAGDGSYVDAFYFTGPDAATDIGNDDNTCSNWSSSSSLLLTGFGQGSRPYAPWWWSAGGPVACSSQYRFLCVED